jgi:dihydrofolate reductase
VRRILVSNMVSLDGYFSGPGSADWQIDWHVVSDDFSQSVDELTANVDLHLYGRVTFEGMASYWTSADALRDDPKTSAQMNNTPKVVVSNTLDKAEWGSFGNARLIKGNVAEEIPRLKQSPGGDIVIFGSGKLVASLTRLGLIDEYLLFTVPVVLGSGQSIFSGVTPPVKLRLLRTSALKTGVIMAAYAPDKEA